MEPIAADLELFADALTVDERLPALYLRGEAGDATPDDLADAAESLLRTLGHLEDASGDDGEFSSDPAVQRLEAKLNLVLRIVADLARRERLPWTEIRWSRRGVSLVQPDPIAAGSIGRIKISLGAQTPIPLELPVRVLSSEPATGGHRLRVKFDPVRPALETAIERHLFRLHRRALARRNR
jgi:hypothetical protein